MKSLVNEQLEEVKNHFSWMSYYRISKVLFLTVFIFSFLAYVLWLQLTYDFAGYIWEIIFA